jgi:hypothetical protein
LRKLFVLRATRPSPSLDGGLPLLWLSFAKRPSNSCTHSASRPFCANAASNAWRNWRFSASMAAKGFRWGGLFAMDLHAQHSDGSPG